MKQKAEGVDLRSLLREAFVCLGDEPATTNEQAEIECRSASVKRSSEDRSRTRQLVFEELARREQASRAASATVYRQSPQVSVAPVQPSLFPFDISPVGERSSTQGGSHMVPVRRKGKEPRTDVRDLVETAYRSLLRPLPEDHVILNPMANAEFIVRCREFGATVSEIILNRTLLNNRKAKRHADVDRALGCRLENGTFERIGHAVEIAASLVQREWFAIDGTMPSVDDMLCDPEQRRVLGVFVSILHSPVDVIDCYLALLAFRKSGREASARAAGVSMPERSLFAPLRSLDPADVPEGGGVYRFLCRRKAVFVSSTATLRNRIREHLERGGPALLPESLPFQIDGPLTVEAFRLPISAPRSAYDSLTRRLRLQRNEDKVPAPPDLNWREAGALFSSQDSVIRRTAMEC